MNVLGVHNRLKGLSAELRTSNRVRFRHFLFQSSRFMVAAAVGIKKLRRLNSTVHSSFRVSSPRVLMISGCCLALEIKNQHRDLNNKLNFDKLYEISHQINKNYSIKYFMNAIHLNRQAPFQRIRHVWVHSDISGKHQGYHPERGL
jgi:hypothetical protein